MPDCPRLAHRSYVIYVTDAATSLATEHIQVRQTAIRALRQLEDPSGSVHGRRSHSDPNWPTLSIVKVGRQHGRSLARLRKTEVLIFTIHDVGAPRHNWVFSLMAAVERSRYRGYSHR